jgi:UvrB/uvrC motif
VDEKTNPDLTALLRSWPHEPGRVNVRMIAGLDGRPKIQVRVELGILQFETTGRPDGLRPEGRESMLEWVREREAAHRSSSASQPFTLNSDECAALREESVQYYHRYVALFVLEDFHGVVRDTSRNLEVFEFCRRFGESRQDREVLEQFRPYVIMMRTRAQASLAMRAGQSRAALAAIDAGLEDLRAAFESRGQLDRYEAASEVQVLRGLRDMVVPKLPSSQRMELEERLRSAIAAENYELAAILRDELRMME